MRKNSLTFFLFLLCTAFIRAQTYSDSKFSISIDLGAGSFFGHSNLSSYGVDYRGEYKNGFSGNIKASYLLDKKFQVGLKFNLFSASENYDLAKETQAADDLDLIYIAPQIGYRKLIAPNWCFDCMVGVGYMHYQSKSLYNEMERECNKGFLGANADLGLNRHLYRNLYMGASVSVMGGHTSSLKEKMKGKEETLKLDKWNRIKVLRADLMLSIKVLL
ncbi:outer membrane beta-barrel protein [Bacteroides stercorirosoris]|uniref:Outer membrane protein beta-barrel domain-containing protein n=1 Tax=Bacteroides stercorirosoris TaxID=871324 RepID=A0A1M6DBX7_9BACE|nr:outer membrane beta-barrel protein [Bacteroides stercorirosoris]SHI70746.1 hypothetical protein SAMN05444350_10671 [Bacteroides stercorirosoris]